MRLRIFLFVRLNFLKLGRNGRLWVKISLDMKEIDFIFVIFLGIFNDINCMVLYNNFLEKILLLDFIVLYNLC